MEKEIDFVERLNREPTKHSTPWIITTRKNYKNRKLQTEWLLNEFGKDYVDWVNVFFSLKQVRGVRFPRMHICLFDDIQFNFKYSLYLAEILLFSLNN